MLEEYSAIRMQVHHNICDFTANKCLS